MTSILHEKGLERNTTLFISVRAMEGSCAILWAVDKTARKKTLHTHTQQSIVWLHRWVCLGGTDTFSTCRLAITEGG